MDDIFTYCIQLPPGIHEMVVPCCDGYTVYLNIDDDTDRRKKSWQHAMTHIKNGDFEKECVQDIEITAHKRIVRQHDP